MKLTKFMRYNIILAVAFFFTDCNSYKEANTYFIQGHVIVDSTTQGKEFLTFDQNGNDAYYPVYYIGEKTDTLFLGHQPISMFSNQKLEDRYDSAKNWNSVVDLQIDVLVDTTTSVGHDIIYSHFSEDDEREFVDSTKSVKAFNVFITNMSDSLVTMGSHNFVGYLTREVQDKDGNWIEVEQRTSNLCGVAKRNLILEPRDIILAKLLRYKGDTKFPFRLKLSIKFGNIEAYKTYSNVYRDYFDMTLVKVDKVNL